jgi:outer membrane protein OmpA-like peptidoglycan-associated protein
MPNDINPNDYNIDFFSTQSLGVTTATNFRDYLLNKNLTEIPEELVNGAAGNFSSKYAEKGAEKSINYTQISDPGNVDEWILEGNYSVSSHEVRDIGMLKGNQYGPPSIQAYSYNNPELIDESTGFLQYPTSTGGDDFKQVLLSDQLIGLGPGVSINFPSDLNDIAKERRKEEAINRVKLKAENNILGKLNLDPFGLLAGQDLILKDYKITTNPTIGGKILEFFTDAVDINIPVSPIPTNAFGKYGDTDGPEAYSDIMKSTGSGTKALIYNSVSVNKYGPTLSEPKGLLANVFGAGQASQKNTYLTPPTELINNDLFNLPIVDKINRAVGKAVDAITKTQIENDSTILLPTENLNPSITLDGIQQNAQAGFDTLPSSGLIDTWNLTGPTKKIEIPGVPFSIPIPDDGPDGPIGTKIPLDVSEDFYPGNAASNGSKNNGVSYDRGMYWGNQTSNPFRKGILKYTQDLINNSRNTKDYKDKARYIGASNDASNFDSTTGRHKNYSMGNTVTDAENKFYCRSWSVRNPYRKVSDLVRHGGGTEANRRSLTREDLNLSVLADNGFVKVAPYYNAGMAKDIIEGNIKSNLEGETLNLGNPSVQKYMLSIENLAWQNTEHILHVPPCEVGPNGGRIMWFPPYNISFTDNSSVNWEATSFIGRGEPVYTYNNTERTGTLTFTLIIDHSMAMTEIKEKGEYALFRYFAGCEDPLEVFTAMVPKAVNEEVKVQQQVQEDVPNPNSTVKEEEFKVTKPTPPPTDKIQFYFRNARSFEKDTIGTNLETELGPNANEQPPNYKAEYTRLWPNGYLRSNANNVPATIISDGTTIPNPAYTATTTSQLDSLNEVAYQDMSKLIDFLLTPDGKRYKIKIIGKTSDAGPTTGQKSNQKLAQARANSTKNYLLKNILEIEGNLTDPKFKATNLGSESTYPTESEWKDSTLRWEVLAVGENDASLSVSYDEGTGQKKESKDDNRKFGDTQTSVPAAIRNRTTLIILEYNKEIDDSIIGPAQQTDPNAGASSEENIKTIPEVTVTPKNNNKNQNTETQPSAEEKLQKQRQEELAKALAAKASRYMAWECSYFNKMQQEDSFIYESLQEKLKYFHPAFHSMTPEGFNARLTFLKQCTRQGPNIAVGEPSNLAFGKPPICVLRVGDFYHTKIVIDSVSFSFDPLQWDLNPEGIGVQPMLCNVDLSFKFIGGSSLGGPITQLQNAVSFNFFANTALYNPRVIYQSAGDYVTKRRDPLTDQITETKVSTTNTKGKNFEYGAYMTPTQSFKIESANNSTSEQSGKDSINSTGDLSQAQTAKQQNDQGIVGKDATPSEENKTRIEDAVSEDQKVNENTDNKGVGDANKGGNENKTIKGFDKKKGVYTVQYAQVLTFKPFGDKKTQSDTSYEKLKIPVGTTVTILDLTGDGVKEVVISQTINTKTSKTFYNKFSLNCGGNNGLDFLSNSYNGYEGLTDGGYYSNSTLANVLRPIFCKGNVPKTKKELTT